MILGRSSLLISDYILTLTAKRNIPLTQFQVIKLVFIAHGRHLAAMNEPLISDRIEAWKHGPVIPVLYQALRVYGDSPVRHLRYCGTPANSNIRNEFFHSILSDADRTIIDCVVDDYGDWTMNELYQLCHEDGLALGHVLYRRVWRGDSRQDHTPILQIRDGGIISSPMSTTFPKREKPSGGGPSGPDDPGKSETDIPEWMKVVIFIHIGMTYGLIIMHGIEAVPFSLGDAPLVALTVSGLGTSLGLVYKKVAKVLGLVPQAKTAL